MREGGGLIYERHGSANDNEKQYFSVKCNTEGKVIKNMNRDEQICVCGPFSFSTLTLSQRAFTLLSHYFAVGATCRSMEGTV